MRDLTIITLRCALLVFPLLLAGSCSKKGGDVGKPPGSTCEDRRDECTATCKEDCEERTVCDEADSPEYDACMQTCEQTYTACIL